MSKSILRKTINHQALVIKVLTKNLIERYLVKDVIFQKLKSSTDSQRGKFFGDQWLFDSPVKRCVFNELYSHFFKNGDLNILDVGGGMTTLMKYISLRNRYTLIEIMNHEMVSRVKPFIHKYKIHWINKSWHEVKLTDRYNYIVANDLFPNVDQRIDLFFRQFLPHCEEMRLSITTYPDEKYYKAQRVDADEILYFKPWTEQDFVYWLNQYFNTRFEISDIYPPDIFIYPNGRKLVLLVIKNI